MKEVLINTDTIKLDQFLKWSGIAYTGGEAKLIIKEGIVKVNGEIETRRGRNLVPGDEIKIEGHGIMKIIRK